MKLASNNNMFSRQELEDAKLSPLQERVLNNGRCPMCHIKSVEKTITQDGKYKLNTCICNNCNSIFIM